jgi:hypothetical protein
MWLTSADTIPPYGSQDLSQLVISRRQIFKRKEINARRGIADSVKGRLRENPFSIDDTESQYSDRYTRPMQYPCMYLEPKNMFRDWSS